MRPPYEHQIIRVLTSVLMEDFHHPIGPESDERIGQILVYLSNMTSETMRSDTRQFAFGANIVLRFWNAYVQLPEYLHYARRARVARFDHMLHVLDEMAKHIGEPEEKK